jgi:DNA-binding GntR family transcriptional regulator
MNAGDPVYSELRRLIIEGRYGPGMRLVEERLAQDLGVSRTPIRQALARVAAEGLVTIYPNRGAVVRTFTHADLIDTYDLRAAMEGYGAYRAAERISDEQLLLLEQTSLALELSLQRHFASREDEIHFLVAQNEIFHTTIIEASGNQRLRTLLPTIVDVPMQFRSFAYYTVEERGVSNFFHRGILRALRDGDADRARSVMQEHIYRGRDVLLESLLVNSE